MLVFGETRFVKFCYWLIDLCSHTEIMATIDGKNKLLSLLWGLDSVFLFCCFLWPLFLTNISKIANQKLQDIDARLLHKWGHLPSAFPVLIRLKDLKKVDRKKKTYSWHFLTDVKLALKTGWLCFVQQKEFSSCFSVTLHGQFLAVV